MKTLALLLALGLQSTGLWPHLDAGTRDRITAAAVPEYHAAFSAPAVGPIATPTLAIPIQIGNEALALGAGSAIAIDRDTATVLYSKNAATPRPIASVTKMVTAIVVLSRHSENDLVTIGQLPNYLPEDEIIGLRTGESYRLGDLVRLALIPSANDAADALAIYDSGSISRFAAQMNIKMNQWGIGSTRFTNPSGLQDTNMVSAEALAKIAGLSLENPFIKATVGRSDVSVTSTSGRTLSATSTNRLLATGRFYGIKTGYTVAAGQCFVGLTRIGSHDVITVILGSADRFGETEQMVNWIGRNYQWL